MPRWPLTTGGCTGRGMDWTAAERRHDPATLESHVSAGCSTSGPLAAAYRPCVAAPTRRRHPRRGSFVGLANVAAADAAVDLSALRKLGHLRPVLGSDPVDVRDGQLRLPGLGFQWLAEP